jgi:hypothetical protein
MNEAERTAIYRTTRRIDDVDRCIEIARGRNRKYVVEGGDWRNG